MADQSDAIVIGGGLAGMAAASYLARAGMGTEVLERADAPGGRARARVQDGFVFNQGPHALYRRGAAAGVLRELEIPYDGALPRGPYKALKGNRLETLPATPGSLVTSRLLPLRAKLEVARWYAALGRAEPRSLARVSAAEWLAQALPHPEARQFAETVVRVSTYAGEMAQHSAEAVVRQLQLARAGVLYLHGGWQTLVEAMREGLARRRVPVHTRAEVASVRPAARGFEVALGDGRVLGAKAVVLAVAPEVAAGILGTAAPSVAAAAAAAIPVRAACLDVALSRLPRPDRPLALGVGRPLYFSVHSVSARLAPAGGALVHVAKYLDSGPATVDDPLAVERELEEVMDRVQPGWREALVRRRFLPEMAAAQALVTAAGGGFAGRPPVEVAEVPGLYLAGDWVGAEGLLADASLASARRAAHALLARVEARERRLTNNAVVGTPLATRLEDAFREHRSFLWGLCYRLTGNAADADDVVQETFVRALRHPPARIDEAWRPWLVRVAMNLGRDVLRRRRRRGYDGPWLPSPVATEPADPQPGPAARYDLMESVTFAFLLALEALTPAQRAVVILRDVFDHSVRETAEALGMSEANVKTTHLRARRALSGYDQARPPRDSDHRERTGAALERFLTCLAQHDVGGVQAMLAEDVVSLSDGGGEFHAARRPVRGRDAVSRLFFGTARMAGAPLKLEIRTLSGLPALVADLAPRGPGWTPRIVIQCEIDAAGRITRLYGVLASRKLTAVLSEQGGATAHPLEPPPERRK